MADGVSINITADTREYELAVRQGMISPVDDATAALEGYVESAKAGGDDLSSVFEQQQQETVATADAVAAMKDQIIADYREMRDQAAPAVQQLTERAEEETDEFTKKVSENLSYMSIGFDGTFQGLVYNLQYALGGIGMLAGPIGALAGAGIGAILGTISTGMQNDEAATEAAATAVSALATKYVEAGKTAAETTTSMQSNLEAMTNTADTSQIISLQAAWKAAQESGANYQGIVDAIASQDPARIQTQIDDLTYLEQTRDQVSLSQVKAGDVSLAQLQQQRAATAILGDALLKAKTQADSAATAASLAGKAGAAATETAAEKAAAAARKAAAESLSASALMQGGVNQVGAAYRTAADDTDKYISKETHLFDVAAFIKAMEARQKALNDYRKDLNSSGLDPESIKYLESQGEASAAAMLTGYRNATPKQQAQLQAIWAAAGDTNASTYGQALGKRVSSIKVPAPKIPAPIVPAPNDSALRAWYRRPLPVLNVPVQFVTRQGVRIG